MTYDVDFYTQLLKDNESSARLVVPFIIDLLDPKSVVDLGCGSQIWLKTFHDNNVQDVLGFDGPWVKEDQLQLTGQYFQRADLSKPLNVPRRFDLAMSIEVAEHLPAASAESFVESLTNLADVVLFSAAIPFQGGTEHVNEQWPDYWQKFFQARGYDQFDVLRPMLWDKTGVEISYRQNMYFYARPAAQKAHAKLTELAKNSPKFPERCVHPALFEHVAANLDESERSYIARREAEIERERQEYQQVINRLRNLEDIPVSLILKRLPGLILSRLGKRAGGDKGRSENSFAPGK